MQPETLPEYARARKALTYAGKRLGEALDAIAVAMMAYPPGSDERTKAAAALEELVGWHETIERLRDNPNADI